MLGVPVMLARTPVKRRSLPRSAVWISSCERLRSSFGLQLHEDLPVAGRAAEAAADRSCR
jgi:hypothetical protein